MSNPAPKMSASRKVTKAVTPVTETPVAPTYIAQLPEPLPTRELPRQRYAAPAPAAEPVQAAEPEDFILLHIKDGYCTITEPSANRNDPGLQIEFGPFKWKDLTYYDTKRLKCCRGLQESLINGELVRISREEMNNLMHQEAIHDRQELQKKIQKQKLKRMRKSNGDMVEAELLNLNQFSSTNASDVIDIAGELSDKTAYMLAYQKARSLQPGLDPRTFSERVQNDKGLVGRLAGQIYDQGPASWSGDPHHGHATVSVPPSQDGGETAAVRIAMTNFNRDDRIAGGQIATYQNYAMPDPAIRDAVNPDDDDDDDDEYGAENIDILAEDNEEPGIRRM